MSRIAKTEAISLKNVSLSGASRYIIALTRDFGKVTLVAKGIKKPKSRFGACLEPFVLSEVLFYHKENRETHYISHCDIIESFSNLRRDLEKIRFAAASVSVIDKVIDHEEKNSVLFDLVFSILTELNRSEESQLFILYLAFLTKLAALLGFQPILDRCLRCGALAEERTHPYFSIVEGGLICSGCEIVASKDRINYKRITPEIREILYQFLTEKFYKNKRRILTDSSLEQLHILLKMYLEYHTDKRIPPISESYLII
ncbi:MAG: DNA repair protein RecO [Candidatus Cloacimonetes bacterium 4572_55]|nr:MAG: DNA repair protein RecO [Candidatus Cloacimonetes bacterium 4572_55]